MKLYLLVLSLLSTIGLCAHGRDYDVNLIVFSKDTPLQLHAFLESLAMNGNGFHTVSVLYQATSDRLARAYQNVHTSFSVVEFIDLNRSLIARDTDSQHLPAPFKTQLCSLIDNARARYFMFATDDSLLIDRVNVRECAQLLAKTKARGFYLWSGKDVLEPELEKCKVRAQFNQIANSIYLWRSDCSMDDGRHPIDMTIFPKEIIEPMCGMLDYDSLTTFRQAWLKNVRADVQTYGLCYERPKLMPLPFKFLPGETQKGGVGRLTAEQQLELFEEGSRIDVVGILNALTLQNLSKKGAA
jgi:hypothetical protein